MLRSQKLIYFPLADGFTLPFLKGGKLLPVAAGAEEGPVFTLSANLHLFMTLGASGVGDGGYILSETAFPVGANKHLASFAVDFKKEFSASFASFPGYVVMLVYMAVGNDCSNKAGGVIPHFCDESPWICPSCAD